MGDEMDKELPKRKPTRLHYFDYNSQGAYFITICTENRRKMLSRIVGCDVLGAPKNVELLQCGKVVEKVISQLNQHYENIDVDKYVIMPNHIHLLLRVRGNGAPRTSHPTEKDAIVQESGAPRTSHPTEKDAIVQENGAPRTSHPTEKDAIDRGNGAPRTSHPTRQVSTVSSFVSTLKRFCNKEIGENIWQISFYDHIIRDQEDYKNHIKYIKENPAQWYFDELYSE